MKTILFFTVLILTGCSSAGQPPTVFEQYMIKRAANPQQYQYQPPQYQAPTTTTCRQSGSYINCTTF
jgi:hypothetical protein